MSKCYEPSASVAPSPQHEQEAGPSMEGSNAAAAETLGVQLTAAGGMGGGGGDLPFLDQIQAAFGDYDVTGVQAHTGALACEANDALGTGGLTLGNDVALATSDLHTAAHEAAHAVQQREGVSVSDGVGAAGDVYEQHADRVADAVVKGESAQSILAEMCGAGALTGMATPQAVQADTGDVEETEAETEAEAEQATEEEQEATSEQTEDQTEAGVDDQEAEEAAADEPMTYTLPNLGDLGADSFTHEEGAEPPSWKDVKLHDGVSVSPQLPEMGVTSSVTPVMGLQPTGTVSASGEFTLGEVMLDTLTITALEEGADGMEMKAAISSEVDLALRAEVSVGVMSRFTVLTAEAGLRLSGDLELEDKLPVGAEANLEVSGGNFDLDAALDVAAAAIDVSAKLAAFLDIDLMPNLREVELERWDREWPILEKQWEVATPAVSIGLAAGTDGLSLDFDSSQVEELGSEPATVDELAMQIEEEEANAMDDDSVAKTWEEDQNPDAVLAEIDFPEPTAEEEAMVREWIAEGQTDSYAIADALFEARHPDLEGQAFDIRNLDPDSYEALEWTDIETGLVWNALREAEAEAQALADEQAAAEALEVEEVEEVDAAGEAGDEQAAQSEEAEEIAAAEESVAELIDVVHVAVANDTLASIADHYYGNPGLYQQLATANELADPNVVEIGMKLKIPHIESLPEAAPVPLADAAEFLPAESEGEPDWFVEYLEGVDVSRSVFPTLWDAWGALGDPQAAYEECAVELNLPPYASDDELQWSDDIDLGVQHQSQTTSTNCGETASQMAGQTGAQPTWGDYQKMGISEDADGHIEVDPASVAEAIEIIDSELEAGRAVVVGVTFCDQETTPHYSAVTGSTPGTEFNAGIDGMSDHWVTIVGRETRNGEKGYPFHDPAWRMDWGDPTEKCFFVYDGGMLKRPGADMYTEDGTKYATSWNDAWFEVTTLLKNASP